MSNEIDVLAAQRAAQRGGRHHPARRTRQQDGGRAGGRPRPAASGRPTLRITEIAGADARPGGRSAQRAQVAGGDRRQVGVEDAWWRPARTPGTRRPPPRTARPAPPAAPARWPPPAPVRRRRPGRSRGAISPRPRVREPPPGRRPPPGSIGARPACPDDPAVPAHRTPMDPVRQRVGPDHRGVVQRRAILAADLEQVLESGVGDQHGAGALALQQGVGGHGGAVQQASPAGTRSPRSLPITPSL